MATPYKVTSPAPRHVWQNLLREDPEAIPYQSVQWLDCICQLGKFDDASRLYEFADGRQCVLPMVRRRYLPSMLTTAASLPSGWGIGGIIASGGVQVSDIETVFGDLSRLPFVQIGLRPNPRAGALWAAAAPPGVHSVFRRAHVIDLQGGFDEVWSKRFTTDTRSQVRKAERLSIEVKCDTTGELVPVFYELFQLSIERWAAKQGEPLVLARFRAKMRDPMKKFELIAKNLGEHCRIWAAWVNGRPAAAILVLQQENANYARGAIDREAVGSSGASELIQKLAIEDACRAGCRYYNMGETGNSASLAHFKERFGAESWAYSEYYLEKLPISRIDAALRSSVKRIIGFKD
jgi:hypothetical protein